MFHHDLEASRKMNSLSEKKNCYLKEKKQKEFSSQSGLHWPDFSDQARSGPHGYNLDPARSKGKEFRSGPGPKENLYFRSEPSPA